MNPPLSKFNPETNARARETVNFQREHYIRSHMDDDFWTDLAKEAGVKLPMFYVRPSDIAIKNLLRQLGLSWEMYVDAYGWQSAEEFEKLNPRYSMRALAGLILELWSQKRAVREASIGAANARGIVAGDSVAEKRYPRGKAKAKRDPIQRDSGNESAS